MGGGAATYGVVRGAVWPAGDDPLSEDAVRVADMTRWEYATTPVLVHNTQAILNTWGEDGWELVSVVTMPEGNLVAYFKRPKES